MNPPPPSLSQGSVEISLNGGNPPKDHNRRGGGRYGRNHPLHHRCRTSGKMAGMSMTVTDALVVTPAGVHDGWLTVEDGRITHVGRGRAPREGLSLAGRTV